MALSSHRRGLWLALVLTLAACEMPPADVLDGPRILAIRTEPTGFVPGEPVTVAALTWAIEGDVTWSACPVAWAPADPVRCPAGPALPLGTGNPLTFTPPPETPGTGWWLLAEGGDAIPAGRRLDPEPDGEATLVNPPDFDLITAPGAPEAPETLTLTPAFDAVAPPLDPARIVISWYVTAGTLEPARTVGLDPATFTWPEDGTRPRVAVIAVARDLDGGTTWSSTVLEVTP